MAAMTSRFNIRCVIQYYSDQWSKLFKYIVFLLQAPVRTAVHSSSNLARFCSTGGLIHRSAGLTR